MWNLSAGTFADGMRGGKVRELSLRNGSGTFVDNISDVIYYSNERSETHIQERQTAEAPSLAGDSVLQGRRAVRTHLHSSC
jgi:hypothetical protein